MVSHPVLGERNYIHYTHDSEEEFPQEADQEDWRQDQEAHRIERPGGVGIEVEPCLYPPWAEEPLEPQDKKGIGRRPPPFRPEKDLEEGRRQPWVRETPRETMLKAPRVLDARNRVYGLNCQDQ